MKLPVETRRAQWSIRSSDKHIFIIHANVLLPLSSHSQVYLPARSPRREQDLRQCSDPPGETQQGTAGRFNAPSVCGHIMAT